MINTGLSRRIDDLGRVCIPKEIRHVLGVKEGEELEVWVDMAVGIVCFKKISTSEMISKGLESIPSENIS